VGEGVVKMPMSAVVSRRPGHSQPEWLATYPFEIVTVGEKGLATFAQDAGLLDESDQCAGEGQGHCAVTGTAPIPARLVYRRPAPDRREGPGSARLHGQALAPRSSLLAPFIPIHGQALTLVPVVNLNPWTGTHHHPWTGTRSVS